MNRALQDIINNPPIPTKVPVVAMEALEVPDFQYPQEPNRHLRKLKIGMESVAALAIGAVVVGIIVAILAYVLKAKSRAKDLDESFKSKSEKINLELKNSFKDLANAEERLKKLDEFLNNDEYKDIKGMNLNENLSKIFFAHPESFFREASSELKRDAFSLSINFLRTSTEVSNILDKEIIDSIDSTVSRHQIEQKLKECKSGLDGLTTKYRNTSEKKDIFLNKPVSVKNTVLKKFFSAVAKDTDDARTIYSATMDKLEDMFKKSEPLIKSLERVAEKYKKHITVNGQGTGNYEVAEANLKSIKVLIEIIQKHAVIANYLLSNANDINNGLTWAIQFSNKIAKV